LRKSGLLLLFSLLGNLLVGQSSDYKFFQFNYQSLPSIQAVPALEYPTVPNFKNNRNIDAKLRFPILLGSKLMLIGQVRYQYEDLHLGYTTDGLEQELSFNNIGATFFYKRQLENDQALFGHFSTNLRAQKIDFNNFSRKIDYSASVVHLFKKSDKKTFGYGLGVANTLGRLRVSPVAIYQNQWHKHWELELKLPKLARLNWKIKNTSNLYFNVEGNSASYYLDNFKLSAAHHIEYRRLTVDVQVGMEQALNEWVWMGFSAGITQPLRSRLVESGQPSRFLVHRFNSMVTPTFNVYLFTVVPQNIIDKFKK